MSDEPDWTRCPGPPHCTDDDLCAYAVHRRPPQREMPRPDDLEGLMAFAKEQDRYLRMEVAASDEAWEAFISARTERIRVEVEARVRAELAAGPCCRAADESDGNAHDEDCRFLAGVRHARAEVAGEPIRVIAVVNWRTGRVHGMTCDQELAQRWVREIGDRYDDDHLSASMTVDLVTRAGSSRDAEGTETP